MPSDSLPPAPDVRVLGPVRVPGGDGRPRAPRGPRAAALVVLLALAGARGATARGLVDELWPDDRPADPRAALQSLVSRLRGSARPGLVEHTEAGYRLAAGSDLSAARGALLQAREALASDDVAGAVAVVDAALSWWSEDPGTDHEAAGFGEVAGELRSVERRLRSELVLLRRDAAEAAGERDVVVRLASDALDADPTDEDAARALMAALAAQGRTTEALRVHSRLRADLVRELGTDPGPQVQALHALLLGSPVDAAAAPAGDVPPAATAVPSPGGGVQLPRAALAPSPVPPMRGLRTYSTAMLGRESEVVEVVAALQDARLVTVLGAGGLGKTRLVQEVARRAAEHGSTVVVVDLVGVRTDDDVVLALADSLGVAPGASRGRLADRVHRGDLETQVAERLRGSRALVVLDNCEHVVDGAALWAQVLLDASDDVRLLATSRAPLLLAGEVSFPLTPLAADPGDPDGGPAVQLFVERARAVRPDAALDPAVVARLCGRLDGLPLAIELAAARVRTLSVAEVEARLDERFSLLRGQDRSVPDRHRTLEAVIDWSWNLLTPGQQTLWRRCATLPDGFSAEAARALVPQVAGWQVDDDVTALVLQSLVRVEERDGTARYRMVETVREFGLLRLEASGEVSLAEDALLDWAVTVSRRTASALLTPRQLEAAAELDREQENLVHAVRRAAARDRPDAVVHGYVALVGTWAVQGAEERATGLAGSVLGAVTGWDVPEEHTDATALALAAVAATSMFGSGPGPARPLARLRRLVRDRRGVGARTRELAALLLAPTSETMAEVLTRMQRSDDAYTALIALLFEAQQEENEGRVDDAVVLAVRAHETAREIGDLVATTMAAMAVASFLAESGAAAASVPYADEAEAGLTTIGASEAKRQVDWVRLAAALRLGDLGTAEQVVTAMASTLDGRDRHRDREVLSVVELGRGEIAWSRGDRAAGVEHLRTAAATLASGPLRGDDAPWFLLIGADALARQALAGSGGGADLVVRIGAVVAAGREVGRRYVDRPVLGTAALGVAVWAGLTPGSPSDVTADGLELLALAPRLGARQDLPALQVDLLREAASQRHAEAVADAEARVARLAPAELVTRTDALLARLADEAGRQTTGGPSGAVRQARFM